MRCRSPAYRPVFKDIVEREQTQPNHCLVVALLGELGVCLRIHQSVQLTAVTDLDLSNPRITFRTLVDVFRRLLQCGIGFDNGSCNWCVDVAGTLDGLNGAHGIARVQLEANLRQLDKDDVTKLLCGVGTDTDGAWKRSDMHISWGDVLTSLATLVKLDPLMVLRILLHIDCTGSASAVQSEHALTSGAAPKAPPRASLPLRLQLLSEDGFRTDADGCARHWQRL